MNYSDDLLFLSNVTQMTSIIANRTKHLLFSNEIEKAHELLNVMSNFTLLLPMECNDTYHKNLSFFQSLIMDLPYSELNELKQTINSALAKIEAHKDFSL
ncbi:hypothetical protein OQ257_08780 [Actinobacillus equuli subsp. equuli]|uniref:Uncharacterized protein n=1 Tax=Actinobacillus equuli subsp. equuli TaxID=202947 RepID=A0A9X4G4M0_ACTEU|nr:hypothetical protein [Actinobacillus equuli]MDE8035258.1 hypothetical protein [Actinobacillus equuli subsp. equuli]